MIPPHFENTVQTLMPHKVLQQWFSNLPAYGNHLGELCKTDPLCSHLLAHEVLV